MKKKMIIFAAVVVLLVGSLQATCKAVLIDKPTLSSEFYKMPQMVRCTCYIDRGYTKSGQWTRPYIVAGRKEWLGKIAVLYKIDEDGNIGEYLGTYEFLDTGRGIDTDGDGIGDSIIKGTSIDVWQPSLDDARKWIKDNGDYVYMQIIDGKG